MICRAKYHAVCYRCGLEIQPGMMIDWLGGGAQSARHAACQTDRERAVALFEPTTGRYVNGVRFHLHDCQSCGKPAPCTGPRERNHDGFPILVCLSFHLPDGTVNRDFKCEECAKLGGDRVLGDGGAVRAVSGASSCSDGQIAITAPLADATGEP